MSKIRKETLRYSDSFKRQVVEEVSRGSSIAEVNRRYCIRGAMTVNRWLKQYGREDLLTEIIYVKMRKEIDRIKELEEENKRLKLALADAVLAKDALETLVEVANEHYSTDLKKNLSMKRSVNVLKKGDKA
ncbi:transposase [Bacteroidales bacterium OttesenSCG-928-K03]|nr:transposase [Bacteroidales bacterium OttesenSCG-928-L14]MDL2242908.1 transposase [Bacteroidales bacterium OttesenSCG-928-K03]